ncbi:hypothetical protein GW7_18434 [Heterocephalus glaber]|uniref:Uncharacterized protein n=1 Tax=Heterocephalus glaber TaxID=10181 RepID=G5AT75_HETGA|nr:hypothetical protein GW7_18434 [Heterocephalus glaber]
MLLSATYDLSSLASSRGPSSQLIVEHMVKEQFLSKSKSTCAIPGSERESWGYGHGPHRFQTPPNPAPEGDPKSKAEDEIDETKIILHNTMKPLSERATNTEVDICSKVDQCKDK